MDKKLLSQYVKQTIHTYDDSKNGKGAYFKLLEKDIIEMIKK